MSKRANSPNQAPDPRHNSGTPSTERRGEYFSRKNGRFRPI